MLIIENIICFKGHANVVEVVKRYFHETFVVIVSEKGLVV